MSPAVERVVRSRADGRCEYCRLPERSTAGRHSLDHIVAQYHGGPTTEANLALCCIRCNLYKGPNLAGIDHRSGDVVRLFNPRKDVWAEHFRYDRSILLGLTSIGRATVSALKMNEPVRVAVREALIDDGLF